jgi:hypothetical protein
LRTAHPERRDSVIRETGSFANDVAPPASKPLALLTDL